MQKDVQISVRITSKLRDQLQALADSDQRKLAGYIALALQEHVDSRNAPPRQASARARAASAD